MQRGITGFCVKWAALAAFVAFSSQLARADYPERVIRIINPFPPGISTDVLARGLAQKLTDQLGQPVIVESRPGANGMIAATAVARSDPDGYTMLLTTGSLTSTPHVAKSASYDALKDFAPITQLAASYGLALVSNLPVNSVPELVALAKQKPGELTYATSGAGNLTHVAGRLFELRSGIKMIAVPYNTPALMSDTLTGTTSMTFVSTVSAVPLVNGGKIKAFAITGPKRCPALPNTPTLKELGYKDYELTGYFGLLFPANVQRDRVERIHREVVKALATPEMKKLIEDAGLYVVGSSPDEFRSFLQKDFQEQGQLIEELGLKAQ